VIARLERWTAIAAVVATSACDRGFRPLEKGDAAPAYAAVSLSGDTVSLAHLRGHAVLLNVWATWCPPCRDEMPGFEQLSQTFRDSGLVVVGVSVDRGGSDSDVREFLTAHGVRFTIVRDPEERIARTFRTVGVPETFLVDRSGRIARRWIGQFDPLSPDVITDLRAALGPTSRRGG